MRAMVDTNVFMRGLLGAYPNEPKAKQCKAFCDAMLDNGKTILVSAPTLAELIRHDGKRIPRIKGVEVIAFDERAAELLGLHLPQAKLNNAKTATNLSLTYLKYDAMIFACAIRGKAQEFVTTDPDHHPLASNTNILVRHPSEYEERQMSLLAIGPQ